MQVVGLVARFQSSPKETYVTVVKRIFKYLKGTMEYGLWYPKSQDFILKEFSDADWAGSVDDRKSTSGAAFFLGNYLVSWLSKRNLPFHSPQQRPNIFLLHHVAHRSFGWSRH